MEVMKNVFWIGNKDEGLFLQIEINHTPEIGDIIHYLCDGNEEGYEYLKRIGKVEFEGKVVSKWTSLSFKEIVWAVEVS